MKCARGIPYPVPKCCCLPPFMGCHTHIPWVATTHQATFCSIYRGMCMWHMSHGTLNAISLNALIIRFPAVMIGTF